MLRVYFTPDNSDLLPPTFIYWLNKTITKCTPLPHIQFHYINRQITLKYFSGVNFFSDTLVIFWKASQCGIISLHFKRVALIDMLAKKLFNRNEASGTLTFLRLPSFPYYSTHIRKGKTTWDGMRNKLEIPQFEKHKYALACRF